MTNTCNTFVTIAIPTYNRAGSFLKETLQSAVSQTYQNIEIIVSDNCSVDHTEAVVNSFHDNRIQYYKQKENIGFLANWNFCLEKAKGEYFIFLLDDDLIDPEFVECCMAAARGYSNVGLILTGTRVIDGEGVMKSEIHNQGSGSSVDEFCLNWFEKKFPLYLCSTLFLTAGLRGIGGMRSQGSCYCDVVAEVQIVANYNTVDVFDIKASFRRHSTNMGSSLDIAAWCEDSLYLLNVLCALTSPKNSTLEQRGMKYFCCSNFRRASRIKGWYQRLKSYWTVSKMFNHCYPLTNFLFHKNIHPLVQRVKRRTQHLVGGV